MPGDSTDAPPGTQSLITAGGRPRRGEAREGRVMTPFSAAALTRRARRPPRGWHNRQEWNHPSDPCSLCSTASVPLAVPWRWACSYTPWAPRTASRVR